MHFTRTLIYKPKSLESALSQTDSAKVANLITAIGRYEKQLIIPDSVRVRLIFPDRYAQEYFTLISDGFDAYKAVKNK